MSISNLTIIFFLFKFVRNMVYIIYKTTLGNIHKRRQAKFRTLSPGPTSLVTIKVNKSSLSEITSTRKKGDVKYGKPLVSIADFLCLKFKLILFWRRKKICRVADLKMLVQLTQGKRKLESDVWSENRLLVFRLLPAHFD